MNIPVLLSKVVEIVSGKNKPEKLWTWFAISNFQVPREVEKAPIHVNSVEKYSAQSRICKFIWEHILEKSPMFVMCVIKPLLPMVTGRPTWLCMPNLQWWWIEAQFWYYWSYCRPNSLSGHKIHYLITKLTCILRLLRAHIMLFADINSSEMFLTCVLRNSVCIVTKLVKALRHFINDGYVF